MSVQEAKADVELFETPREALIYYTERQDGFESLNRWRFVCDVGESVQTLCELWPCENRGAPAGNTSTLDQK